MQNSIFRSEDTITLCTTFATVSCAMVAFSLPIEGKRLPGRILIFTVCLTGKIFEILELFQFDFKLVCFYPPMQTYLVSYFSGQYNVLS